MGSTATVEWLRVIPEIAAKWVLVLALLGFLVMILYLCVKGKIDLSTLLNDPGLNKASLSRFQLLLSTFVIVGCYLAITLTNPPDNGILYDIPSGLLVFFGISGGSYLVSTNLSGAPPAAGGAAGGGAGAAGGGGAGGGAASGAAGGGAGGAGGG
jgi:hypothetical protein